MKEKQSGLSIQEKDDILNEPKRCHPTFIPQAAVISTAHEGAKRLRGSGEIPTLRPLPGRYELFYQNSPAVETSKRFGENGKSAAGHPKENRKLGILFREQNLNSQSQPDGAGVAGISPLPLSRFAPSESVEMTRPKEQPRSLKVKTESLEGVLDRGITTVQN